MKKRKGNMVGKSDFYLKQICVGDTVAAMDTEMKFEVDAYGRLANGQTTIKDWRGGDYEIHRKWHPTEKNVASGETTDDNLKLVKQYRAESDDEAPAPSNSQEEVKAEEVSGEEVVEKSPEEEPTTFEDAWHLLDYATDDMLAKELRERGFSGTLSKVITLEI